MTLSWELDGADWLVCLYVLKSCAKNISFQLSPDVAETEHIELFILGFFPSHLNQCHFPSSPEESEKEGKRRTDIMGKQRTKNFNNKKKESSQSGCLLLTGSLSLWTWYRASIDEVEDTCEKSHKQVWASLRVETCSSFHYHAPQLTSW